MTELKMKRLKTTFSKDGYKTIEVEVDPEVYQAFVAADFCGFTRATETQNVVEVEVGTGRDDSKWQHVLQDEIGEVMGC